MKYISSILLFCLFTYHISFAGSDNPSVTKEQAKQWMQRKPVQFLENKGQMTDANGKLVPFVFFKANAAGINIYITGKGLTYVFLKSEEEDEKEKPALVEREHEKEKPAKWERIDMELQGASIKKENIIKEGASSDFSQFFFPHCPEGITDVHSFQKITIKDIYPNIDWVLYNAEGKSFKYDFIVNPGADPKLIELVYSSLNPLTIKEDGNLEIKTEIGELQEQAPYSYFKESNQKIESQFQITSKKKLKDHYQTHVTITLMEVKGASTQTLVIDPQLTWATFYGGNDGWGPNNISCDLAGNVFISGSILSPDLPLFDPGSGAYFQGTFSSGEDIIISKFNNSGVLSWSTYYGGSDYSSSESSLNIDINGNIYLTGYTFSSNFPTQDLGGGAYFQGTNGGNIKSFILKFNNAGIRLWATYFGGTSENSGASITTNASGNVFLLGNIGTSSSSGFSIQGLSGAYNQSIGGSGDMFIAKFDMGGTLLWSTLYGGIDSYDNGSTLLVDGAGNLLVTGSSSNPGFPTLAFAGAYNQPTNAGKNDAFLIKFNSLGALIWSTYLGGEGNEAGISIKADANNSVFLVGTTDSTDFPTLNPGGGAFFQGAYGGGVSIFGMSDDIFISKFSDAGVLLWSTYYGGNGGFGESLTSNDAVAIDHCGNIYITFFTTSPNLFTLDPGCSTYFHQTQFSPTNTNWDNVIAMFSNSGKLVWATYFGGESADDRQSLTLDTNNNLFMTGEWASYELVSSLGLPPLTDPGGGAYYDPIPAVGNYGFITKFSQMPLTLTNSTINTNCGCTGTGTVNTNGGCGPYTYLWSNGQTTQTGTGLCAGNYTVTVNDAFCSTATQIVTIVGSAFSLNTLSTPTSCTNNGSATVILNGGTNPFTYSWSPTGGSDSTATGLVAGTYTVTVTDANGCSQTQTAIVTSSNPTITITTTTTNAICNANGTATAITSGGVTPYTYLWNNGQTTQTATGLTAGTYTVIVTDANACSQAQSVTITASAVPVATASALPVLISQGDNSQLSATGGGTYSWFPVTGLSCSNCPNPKATPLETTDYCVTVTNIDGCSDSACVKVFIDLCADADFTIPNAFSPNNDGHNDVFILQGWGNCVEKFSINIFNRWGEKVFESNDPAKGWNGAFNGKPVNQDVFVYYIKATLINGEKISRKGNISLIR